MPTKADPRTPVVADDRNLTVVNTAVQLKQSDAEHRAFLASMHPAQDLILPKVPAGPSPVDSLVGNFRSLQRWADANGHGNSDAVIGRIVRDLDSLRSLPREAWDLPSSSNEGPEDHGQMVDPSQPDGLPADDPEKVSAKNRDLTRS